MALAKCPLFLTDDARRVRSKQSYRRAPNARVNNLNLAAKAFRALRSHSVFQQGSTAQVCYRILMLASITAERRTERQATAPSKKKKKSKTRAVTM